MSFEDANQYLGNRNWAFIALDEPVFGVKQISWAYGKNEDVAISWLSIYTNFNMDKLIRYQTQNVKTINNLKRKLKESGFKNKETNFTENQVQSLYYNNSYELKLLSEPTEYDNTTKYIIEINRKPRKPSLSEIKKAEEKRRLDSIEWARRNSSN